MNVSVMKMKYVILIVIFIFVIVPIIFAHTISMDSLSNLTERVEHGDADSRYNVGVCYDEGPGGRERL